MRSLFLIFIAIFWLGQSLYADQLVFITVPKGKTAEQFAKRYPNTVFQEDRFLLAVEGDNWQPSDANEIRLGEWLENHSYFVLYPLKQKDYAELENYGKVLRAEERFLIFETTYPVLNDFPVFHRFKIVRIFNRPIIPLQNTIPIEIPAQPQFNSAIQQMVDNVSVDTIWQRIGVLQSMERYTQNPNAMAAADYLKNYYYKLGYDTVYFHTWHSGWIPNVIAVKYGKLYPDEVYLLGGHYDVYTNGAPGADDNGSGTAAILEIARVMAPLNYQRTVKIVNFSGEELGLLGSAAYASQAAQQGENILGMINMDMIAYVAPGDPIDVDVVSNTASTDLYNAYIQYSQTYVPTLSIIPGSLPFGASSDHASFWQNGYKAIFPFEDSDHYSPYIHSSQDVLGISANNQTLAELGTKSVVATLASLAEIAEAHIAGHVYSAATLDPIQNATVYFNGDSVFTNQQGFFMTPALTPGSYQIVFTAPGFVADTVTHTIQQYEFLQLDAFLIPAGSQRPYVHLQNVVIDDDSSGGSLGNNNGIADAGETVQLFGRFFNSGNVTAQNIVATAQTGSQWVTLLHDSLRLGTLPPDSTAISQNALLVEIDPQTPANMSVPFTLTIHYQGYVTTTDFQLVVHNRGQVLIVQDDDGSGLSPYTTALDSLGISYDVTDAQVTAAEMAEYDYLIWFCGEEYNNTLTSGDQLKLTDYLNNGGKLFISGVDIGYDIHNDPFYSNYLKAQYIGDGPYSAITTAYGISGDPISGVFSGGLAINDNWVDQIVPTGGSDQIFYYTYQGSNFGCGVKYDGGYQLVYLTFAFENVPSASDREILMGNIVNWFGVPTEIEHKPGVLARSFLLRPNYPNPFNSETIISFSIPRSGKALLEIYDVLGRRVKTLLHGRVTAGDYQIRWNGRNQWGQSVSSGVYFYRLQSGEQVLTRKLLLIR